MQNQEGFCEVSSLELIKTLIKNNSPGQQGTISWVVRVPVYYNSK
jgi:hypothetical protein